MKNEEERLAKENQIYDLEIRIERLNGEIRTMEQDIMAKRRKIEQYMRELSKLRRQER